MAPPTGLRRVGLYALVAGVLAAPLVVPYAVGWFGPPPSTFAPGGEERLLADLDHLAATRMYAGRGTRSDAAPTLNRLVRSDLPSEGLPRAWWADGDALEPVRALGDDTWLDHPEITGAFDVAFLAEWRAWDHWAWDTADPFAAHFAAHPTECALVSPTPTWRPFLDLAKVRLAQGYAGGDLAAAAGDVEHLAMLVHSTDTLVGAVLGGAILTLEDTALARAAAEGREVPSRAWTRGDLELLKPAVLAVAALVVQDPSSEAAQRLVARSGELPGVCAGLVEAAAQAGVLRSFAGQPWPGEGDYRRLVTGIDAALATSPCAIPAARRMWEAADHSSCADAQTRGEAAELALRIPYVRAPYLSMLRRVAALGIPAPYGAPAE